MTGYLSVYSTAPTVSEAENIALRLIEEEVVACVNILPGIRSFYRWQGGLEKAEECGLIIKTHQSRLADVERVIKSLSSYACPCIVAWPIVAGHGPYLQWLGEQVTIHKRS